MPVWLAVTLPCVGAHAQGAGTPPPSAAPSPVREAASPAEIALGEAVQRLAGRVDELSRQVQRQEQDLGALAARTGPAAPPAPVPPGPAVAALAAPPPAAPARPLARPAPAAAQGSTLPALIVMVGGDASVTLQGRPVALPTIGFALQAAADGDASRRVVVGAEPGVSAARVGEVVGAVSQAGFGRITITGP